MRRPPEFLGDGYAQVHWFKHACLVTEPQHPAHELRRPPHVHRHLDSAVDAAESLPRGRMVEVYGPESSGTVFDLGLSAGAFKTFILRGSIPPGSRYSILGSMDGHSFQEVILFTSDQQGARRAAFLCRFLRVQRDAGGPTPVIAFGSEGILEGGAGGGTSEISIADGEIETTSVTDEEVLRQYRVPLALLSSATLRATLAGEGPTDR